MQPCKLTMVDLERVHQPLNSFLSTLPNVQDTKVFRQCLTVQFKITGVQTLGNSTLVTVCEPENLKA